MENITDWLKKIEALFLNVRCERLILYNCILIGLKYLILCKLILVFHTFIEFCYLATMIDIKF